MKTFVGVDFGAKLAGTTAICYESTLGELTCSVVSKGIDADAWLLHAILELRPEFVFIDAPLSLPLVYSQPKIGTDYFFRESDKQLRAMSPMFLGGLTARAMQLNRNLRKEGVKLFEVYPARLAEAIYQGEKERYKTNVEGSFLWFAERLSARVGKDFKGLNSGNWHQIDAILAWWSGWRFFQGEAGEYGNPSEGLILV